MIRIFAKYRYDYFFVKYFYFFFSSYIDVSFFQFLLQTCKYRKLDHNLYFFILTTFIIQNTWSNLKNKGLTRICLLNYPSNFPIKTLQIHKQLRNICIDNHFSYVIFKMRLWFLFCFLLSLIQTFLGQKEMKSCLRILVLLLKPS